MYEFRGEPARGTPMYHPPLLNEMVAASIGMDVLPDLPSAAPRRQVDREFFFFRHLPQRIFVNRVASFPTRRGCSISTSSMFNSRVFPVPSRYCQAGRLGYASERHHQTCTPPVSTATPLPPRPHHDCCDLPETGLGSPRPPSRLRRAPPRASRSSASNPGDLGDALHTVITHTRLGHNLPILTGASTVGVAEKLGELVPAHFMGTTAWWTDAWECPRTPLDDGRDGRDRSARSSWAACSPC